MSIPIVDLSTVLLASDSNIRARASVEKGRTLVAACREFGFFYVSGYSSLLPAALEDALDAASRDFFRLPVAEKSKIRMELAGRAWRGYFPVGGELTSNRPDLKEGIYFGTDHASNHPLVQARTPLFGANLFPQRPANLESLVKRYMASCEAIGHVLLSLLATGLGLPPSYFRDTITQDPTLLFRIFHYPPPQEVDATLRDPANWGVGEHTDYGLLTLLKQDHVGGLEVKSLANEWIPVRPIPYTLVVNLGDMLESMTNGLLRSTPHRVRNETSAMRLSFPFFFDPSWNSVVRPLPLSPELKQQAADAAAEQQRKGYRRWDASNIASVHFDGEYGRYLLSKVAKVFPELAATANRPKL